MTSSKHTKKALLASVLSVVLCCAMLVGSTFAWFTDSVTSTGNKIVAGNLKVDLVHVGGGEDGADVSIKENSDHKIFDYDKWEPGYTVMETLKVVNKGNLALKFRLDAVAAGATTGPTGEKLAEVIDVYVYTGTDDPADTTSFKDMTVENGWRNAGSLATLMADPDGIARGVLLPENTTPTNDEPVKEVQMTVALHMQQDAGNAYQGLTLGRLNFTLNATQYTYEEDAFDDQYDAQAEYPVWHGGVADDEEMASITDEAAKTVSISTPEQLAGLAAAVNAGNSYEGYTVNLLSDINLNNVEWTPIGNVDNGAGIYDFESLDNVFKGNFNGNDHIISNLKIENGGNNAGFFGLAYMGAARIPGGEAVPVYTIENVHFVNATVVGDECAGVLAGAVNGGKYDDLSTNDYSDSIINVTVTNANVTANKYAGGIIGYAQTSLSNVMVTDSTITTQYDAAFVGSSTENDSGENAGAIVGDLYALHHIDTAVVRNCTVSGNTKLGGVAGSSHHADYIRNCTVINVKMIIGEDSSDNKFGWITGRAGSRNVPNYVKNTVSGCTAVQGTTSVTVEDVHSV